jgi:hypothetical protein
LISRHDFSVVNDLFFFDEIFFLNLKYKQDNPLWIIVKKCFVLKNMMPKFMLVLLMTVNHDSLIKVTGL